MHCPSCNKTLAAGSKCPKCGKMAVASSSDEIDLMPLDVSKEAEAESYQPFPEGPPPPSAKPAKSAPKHADPAELDVPDEVKRKPMPQAYEPPQQSNLMLYVGGGIAGLIILFGLWRMIRTENKIVFGKERFDTTWIVQANSAQVENFDITGTIKWTLDVTPTDDSVLVGVVKRVQAWMDGLLSASGSTLAITHPTVIRAAIVSALGAGPHALRHIDIAPLSRAKLSSDGRRWTLSALIPRRR